MSLNIFFICLSFLFGAWFVRFLRKYDVHEKEPFHKMALVAIWGGAWSIVIAIFLYRFSFSMGIEQARTAFHALCVIGPVEEGAKLAALFSSYFLIRKDLNEPTDGLIYMSCVALGFSLIENYFYATETAESGHLLLLRLVVCTPTHILFSALMGLAFYAVVKAKASPSLLLLSFLYAASLHGMYDLAVFKRSLFVLSLLGFILFFAYSLTLSFLGYTTARSPFRKSLAAFVRDYESPGLEEGIECLNCGSRRMKRSYGLGKIRIQKCDQCGVYLSTRNSLYHIFHHFGSTFRNLTRLYRIADPPNEHFRTLYKGNLVSDAEGIASFQLDEMSDVLEERSRSVIREIEHRWWFPRSLAGRLA